MEDESRRKINLEVNKSRSRNEQVDRAGVENSYGIEDSWATARRELPGSSSNWYLRKGPRSLASLCICLLQPKSPHPPKFILLLTLTKQGCTRVVNQARETSLYTCTHLQLSLFAATKPVFVSSTSRAVIPIYHHRTIRGRH